MCNNILKSNLIKVPRIKLLLFGKKILLWILWLTGFGLINLQAQEATLPAGGEAMGSEGSVSYSVGQVVYTINTGAQSYVVQGVQQPFEISVVSSTDKENVINLKTLAYPNPAGDFLILSVDDFEFSDLSYQLYDMNGKLLEIKKVESSQTRIVMSNLVSSVYFVKVVQNSRVIKTFKIIKAQ